MSYLIEKLLRFDTKTAIIHNEKRYSYKELLCEIEAIKKHHLKDIPQGSVVAILSDYSFYSIALLLALYENKNIIVPITSTLQSDTEEKIQESLTNYTIDINSGYKIRATKQNATHPMIEALQEREQSGLVLFSSGSTGKPKAMIHNFESLVESYRDKKEKSLNMILFLMFDHIGGLNTLLNILTMGATMIIPQDRNADKICKLLQDYEIRVLPSSPTFLNLIIMSKAYERYDLSRLRMVTYGTEAMPESLLSKLQSLFPKTKFLQTFGTSETGIINTSSLSSNSTYMKLDDPNQEYKIVKGELWLRSKTQIMGYLNASMDSFSDDGWFKSGDLVETAKDGYIKIIGRSKELINVGGQKVLPNEVESVLLGIECVEDAMVYGEQNAITGQTVVCELVLNLPLTSREAKKLIRKECKNRLESYKIPTKVKIVDKTNFSDRFKKIRIKS